MRDWQGQADGIVSDLGSLEARRGTERERDRPSSYNWIWVLSGGGAKGDFEVGALIYLATRMEDFRPVAVCGTSVGAINAVGAAEASRAGLEKVKDTWLSLVANESMYIEADWLKAVRQLETFKDFDIGGVLSGEGGGGDGGSGRIELLGTWDHIGLLAGTLLLPGISGAIIGSEVEDIEDDLNEFKRLFSGAQSVFSLEPTRQLLESKIDADAITEAGTLLRLVAVDLEYGTKQYVTEKGELIGASAGGRSVRVIRSPSLKETFVNGALASAAIPATFPPVHLTTEDGFRFTLVDGGARDILPMDAAYDILLHEPRVRNQAGILALSASPAGASLNDVLPRKGPRDFQHANLLDIAKRGISALVDEIAYNDINCEKMRPAGSRERIEIHRRARRSPDVEAVHIGPKYATHGGTMIDPGLIQINIAYGYMSAFDRLSPQVGSGDRYRVASEVTVGIVERRRMCWEMETNHVRFHAGPGVVEPQTAWEEDDIALVRNLKRQVRQLVEARVGAFGRESVPFEVSNREVKNTNSVNDWWQQWERHSPGTGPDMKYFSTNPFTRWTTPWQELRKVGGGEVPSAEPPPDI